MFFPWPPISSSLAEWLAAALHVLLAGIVTVDVLLKKSDVRGALGWIGAAWMSPVIGSLLYYMFGINRVTRRSLRLPRQDGEEAPLPSSVLQFEPPNVDLLARTGGAISARPLVAGNGVVILQGGDKAYPAMLAAIEGARRSVALTSYIFRNDAAGHAFSDALAGARKRGVEVRVLLDGVGIGYVFPRILYRLRAAGVPTARFLHTLLPWRMPFLNMRNHRKLLVIDGATAFMGGMNVGAEYSADLDPEDHIDDTHFRIRGPAVRFAMDAFARDWTFTTGETLDGDCWWPDIAPAGPVCARGLRSGPDTDIYRIEMILGAALTLAKRRVRIVTPYFLPDQRLQFAIAQACLRGVEVEIVIPAHCDFIFLDWAMRAHLRFFGNISAHVYATPAPFDHSKLVTMDGAWCLIGSSNWDTRSFRLNFEFDMECYDDTLTKEIDAIIDAKIGRAAKLSPDALRTDPLAARLRDAAARLLAPYL
ncbi:MAG: PLDc N-terminal domain-containing protein [Alphaproteobacteria bacterium]|nr:PLDc N-terminal domain-containing protein [Alphaproteobacteria bacterium]